MKKKYIVGITIGPIVETFQTATFPAALWFCSNFFSDVARRICVKTSGQDSAFCKNYGVALLSPCLDLEREDGKYDDGVGRYNDRVILGVEIEEERVDALADDLQRVVDDVKTEVVELFPIESAVSDEKNVKERWTRFLKSYLQINFCIIIEDENANPVLQLTPYLDSLELMRTFCGDDADNPFVDLFLQERRESNAAVKISELFERISSKSAFMKQFLNGDRIRSIENVAQGPGEKDDEYQNLKKSVYYAIVYADGDNMGSFLKEYAVGERAIFLKRFSEKCFDYNCEAAKAIGRFGGMTIYAGGDDLLFLAPIEGTLKNGSRGNLLDLFVELNKIFQENLAESIGANSVNDKSRELPTLSFGVAVQYKKFPLYEAYDAALKLLFGEAKKVPNKNAVALRVQKHSGQTFAITTPIKEIAELSNAFFSPSTTETELDANKASGAIQTLVAHKKMFKLLMENAPISSDSTSKERDRERFKSAWNNFFDNEGQAAAKSFTDKVADYLFDHRDVTLDAVIQILQYRKFLLEKKGEDEEDEGDENA